MITKDIAELKLSANEKLALVTLKSKLEQKLPGCEIVLFGSKARGEGDAFSDLDILIIVDSRIDRELRETISDISYPLELEFNVVFGKIIENKAVWNTPLSRSMPLHWNIDREGVRL